ncbi:unnamed protein product [Polarella glacialis]|uniref:Uncharacterized protein n=1 Tax=Polarella glacialis TaxID=89957 RepID=A0A813IXV0_POLGL|nr:unnamed protein product [Polarella glacialis]
MRELVYKDRLQDDAVEAKIEELYRAFSVPMPYEPNKLDGQSDVSTFSPQLGLQFLQHRSPAGCVLPIVPYAPGRAPPPHLSPFVGDNAEGYVLRQGEILDDFAQEVGIMGCSWSHARRKQTITRALMTARK